MFRSIALQTLAFHGEEAEPPDMNETVKAPTQNWELVYFWAALSREALFGFFTLLSYQPFWLK